ncbi:MAG: hypothetical protein K2L82_02930 [Lachnospiraceae bacterium]|nr:hypothetical protein [Lachnospiraceae bacterium]
MLNQKQFLKEYNLEQTFQKSGLEWKLLEDIYDDYREKVYPLFQELAGRLVTSFHTMKKNMRIENPKWGNDIHVIYGRAKEPEHVVEKVVRKVGSEDSQKYQGINVDNYKDILRDLIGIRIIVIKKEGWKEAHNLICALFDKFYDDTPKAYVCYGDRKIFDAEQIDVDYTVKGYRSQHYIIQYEMYYAEIQVRTMAEEVYGEFDHRVRYPYFKDNKFLIRYTNMISRGIAELDDMISTCMQLDDKLLEELNHKFEEDKYVDWAKEQGDPMEQMPDRQLEIIKSGDAIDILNYKLL